MIASVEGQNCSPTYFPQPSDGIVPDTDSERVERVSLNDDESEIFTLNPPGGNCGGPKGNSHPWISDDGDRIVFSTRSLTVAGESNPGNDSHLLLRVVSTGATYLISGRSPVTGTSLGTVTLANGVHDFPRMSGNGQWIAWSTGSSNLTPDSPLGGIKQIYVHEVDTGTTSVLSEQGGAPRHGNGDSVRPFLDETGNWAVFETFATNLWDDYGVLPYGQPPTQIGPGGFKEEVHLWHRDPVTGATNTTWVSVGQAANGNLIFPDGPSKQATVSANGCYVAWESTASNLVPQGGNTLEQILMRDMTTGEIFLVSKNFFGLPASGQSTRPVFSRDGRWIVFESTAHDLIDLDGDGNSDDTNGLADVFVWDRLNDSIVRVSVDSSGNEIIGTNSMRTPSYSYISSNGRFVFFTSGVKEFNKPAGGTLDDANEYEFYMHDRDPDNDGIPDEQASGEVLTIRVSNVPTDPGPGSPGTGWSGGNCAASGDGRFVVYMSVADDFVDPNDVGGVDTNGAQDCTSCGTIGCPAEWGRDIFRREMYTQP